jgi:Flp pilus assembly protein TadD
LGRILLESGKPDLALAEFGRALALAPNDPKALNNRGAALAALGQTEAARADFERALERDPCFADALSNLRRLGVARPRSPDCRSIIGQSQYLR